MRLRAWVPAGWGVAAVLAPKCPMCVAGYLAALGLGAGVSASIALVLRPTLAALAVLTAALLVIRWAHRRRRCSSAGSS